MSVFDSLAETFLPKKDDYDIAQKLPGPLRDTQSYPHWIDAAIDFNKVRKRNKTQCVRRLVPPSFLLPSSLQSWALPLTFLLIVSHTKAQGAGQNHIKIAKWQKVCICRRETSRLLHQPHAYSACTVTFATLTIF